MNSTSGAPSARLALVGVFLAWSAVSTAAVESHGAPRTSKLSSDDRREHHAPSDQLNRPPGSQPQHEGELTEPITSVIKHPASFLDRFDKHSWSGNVVPRKCTKCTEKQHTTVSIGAIEDAHTVDYRSLPTHGVIMARLENTGPWKEARYGIPPHAVWYMLWGGVPSDSKPRARFVKVEVKYLKKRLVFDTTSYAIDTCAHKDTLGEKRPDADFKTCEVRSLSSATADAWLSCSQGCCTAGGDTTRTDTRQMRR